MDKKKAPEKVPITTPTTPEERKLLQEGGFVHITNLRTVGPLRDEEGVVEALANQLGCWETNNGKIVVVTMGGEVWLAATIGLAELSELTAAPLRDIRGQIIVQLCPNGREGWVPCSNGENIHLSDILRRMANPGWQPRTASSPQQPTC